MKTLTGCTISLHTSTDGLAAAPPPDGLSRATRALPRCLALFFALFCVAVLAQPCAAGRVRDVANLPQHRMSLIAGGSDSGNALTGVEAPAETADGRGSFDNQGDTVTFHYHVHVADGSTTGYLAFCDLDTGLCLMRAQVTGGTASNNATFFSGSGRLPEGTQVTFNAGAIEDPISGTSLFVSLSNGYYANGKLISGHLRFF